MPLCSCFRSHTSAVAPEESYDTPSSDVVHPSSEITSECPELLLRGVSCLFFASGLINEAYAA